MRTIGIDLAAAAKKTGLVTIDWSDARAVVVEAISNVTDEMIGERVGGGDKVGIDAPFGWPTPFVENLLAHHAGRSWVHPTDAESRRALQIRRTDRGVQEQFGVTPLAVSADRIAVPAMRCARLQAQLGGADRTGGGKLVEVYPAAALKSWGLPHKGYKTNKKDQPERRRTIFEMLVAYLGALEWKEERCKRACVEDADVLDALVSALVARATALGMTTAPREAEMEAARVEGWIHVPSADSLGRLVVPS